MHLLFEQPPAVRVLSRNLGLGALHLLAELPVALEPPVEFLALLARGLLLPGEGAKARLDIVAVGQARDCGARQGLAPQQFEVDNDVGRALYERLVVGDEEHRLPAAEDEALQPLERVQVQVIRGLVQEIELRLLSGDAGKLHFYPLPTGELAQLAPGAEKVRVQLKLRCERGALLGAHAGKAGGGLE